MSTLFSNPNPFGQPQQTSAPSLFGSTTQTSQPQNNSLFGNSTQNQQQGSSLFGNASQAQPNQTLGSSLFGNANTQQQKPSLFGNTASAAPPSNSLFGNTTTAAPQNQSLFGGSLNQPQQQTAGTSTLGTSTFGGSTLVNQPQGLQQSQARSLWQAGNGLPREKTIPDQVDTLRRKWRDDSPSCVFKKYFYNNVGAVNVPHYGPGPNEDETKWEEALSKKPSEGDVPTLYTGWRQLGERLRLQVRTVQALNVRLHEINNSLATQQQQHELDVSVRAVEAKRRHVALSQRCLRLATKVQVLRNRGYVMDAAEEELKKNLSELEKSAFDPSLSGRQEEIWARMLGIEERTKMLQVEAERTGDGLADKPEEGIDEDVLRKTKKILSDYDSQIAHLNREVSAIRKDLDDWQDSGSRRLMN